LAAAVLNPDGMVIHDGIEEGTVQWAGDRFVVADTATPTAGRSGRGRPAKRDDQGGPVANRGRSALDRLECGGECHEVKVMVVQTRQERPVVRVQDRLAPTGPDSWGDLGDLAATDLYIKRPVTAELRFNDEEVPGDQSVIAFCEVGGRRP
jgi:hypothetical protein